MKKDELRKASENSSATTLRTDKGQQGVLEEHKDPSKNIPNPHREHQDRHGSGEGETGMQPGAGHPHGR